MSTHKVLFALVGSALLFAGCNSTLALDLTLSRMSFSERLRPDVMPLDLIQVSQVPMLMSDGGSAGAELVSPLYPGETDLGIVRSMPVSDVLWTGRQSVRLSWETLVWDPRFNGTIPTLTTTPYGQTTGGPKTKRLTVNARGVVQPVTREFLVHEDTVLDRSLFPRGFYVAPPGLTIAVVACTDGAARTDPRNPPLGLDQGCSRRAADPSLLCLDGADRNSYAPMTVIKCLVPVTADSSLRLEVVDVNDLTRSVSDVSPGVAHDPKALLPHVKIVSGPRVLARRLHFQTGSEECLMRPAGGGNPVPCAADHLDKIQVWRMCRHEIPVVPPINCSALPPGMSTDLTYDSLQSRWAWNVVDPSTGRWTENFTDDVHVSFVKFFVVRRDDGVQRYLGPEEIRFLNVGNRRCHPAAEPGTGHARVDTFACENVRLAASPAWSAPAWSQAIDWDLRLIARAQDNVVRGPFVGVGVLVEDLAALPHDALFIEFHLSLQ